MEILFIVSLLTCIISTILKGVIHVALDIRNKHNVDFARSKGYVYFLPYSKNVSEEDEKLKRICNFLHRVFIISLIIFIIVYLVRYIVNQ